MTTARYPQVTDDLLSAYIDDAVTDDERLLVETAVGDDPDIAWRLTSLRATVTLLRELPALALPRAFILTPEQLEQTAADPVVSGGQAVMTPIPPKHAKPRTAEPIGFWPRLRSGWQNFWGAGNPALRNAMAASFALLAVLMIGPRIIQTANLQRPYGQVQINAAVSAPGPVAAATSGTPASDETSPQPTVMSRSGAVSNDAETVTRAVSAQPSAAQSGDTASAVSSAAPAAGAAQPTVDSLAATAEDSSPSSEVAGAAAPDQAAAAVAFPSTLPANGVTESYAVDPAHPEANEPPPEGAASAMAVAPAGAAVMSGAPPAISAAPGAAADVMRSAPASSAAPAPVSPAMPAAAAAALVSEMQTEGALPPSAKVSGGSPATSAMVAQDATANAAAGEAAPQTLSETASTTPSVAVSESATSAPTIAATAIATAPAAEPTAEVTATAAVQTAVQLEKSAAGATMAAAAPAPATAEWLAPWAQLAAALATLFFGLLWWRSRR